MKIIIITSLILFNINLTFSQNEEFDKLNETKKELISMKEKIDDSIKKIDVRLNFLKSKSEKFNSVEQDYTETMTRSKAKIKDKPAVYGKIIGYIPKDKLIKVYDYHETYWLVEKDSIKGYTSEMYLNTNIEMKKMKMEHDENEIRKKYGESIANKILNHRIWIGMTDNMARLSIGNPIDINRTTGTWGVHEQWIYENKYLYFENGELTSWQN